MYFLDWHMTVTNFCELVFAENFPAITASAMMDGCLESGKDTTLGGALYNQSSFCAMGTANLADGLMAIKKLCFDEKRYTLRYFYDALCANWEGYEELRQVIRNECPHYGNGEAEVDDLAAWSLRYYAEHLNTHDCPRGKFCGGTFTVTNLGGYGSVDFFTPIVNPPQAAILGVGRIRDTAVPAGGTVGIRPTLGLSLTYDHRVADGAVAAGFMQVLIRLIENPIRYLLR
jgi:hypothetical protein